MSTEIPIAMVEGSNVNALIDAIFQLFEDRAASPGEMFVVLACCAGAIIAQAEDRRARRTLRAVFDKAVTDRIQGIVRNSAKGPSDA